MIQQDMGFNTCASNFRQRKRKNVQSPVLEPKDSSRAFQCIYTRGNGAQCGCNPTYLNTLIDQQDRHEGTLLAEHQGVVALDCT